MSKIHTALGQAEQERAALLASGAVTAPAQFDRERAREIRQQGHSWTQSVRVPSPASPATATGPAGSQGTDAAQSTDAFDGWESAAPPESVGQAMDVVKRQLAVCEEHSARQTAEAARLGAQLAAAEELLAQTVRERASLQERLDVLRKASAAAEAERAMWCRQLESLRECQVLSHAVDMAEREAKAHAALMGELARSQQAVAQEIVQGQARAQQLDGQVSKLRFQLAQALALTGTARPATHAPRHA